MHRRWLSLPLLTSIVSAFYPYHDGGEQKDKRFIPIPELASSDVPGIITVGLKKIQTKRDNSFPVVLSSKPTAPNSMAIDQDGGDFSYFSTMSFGSKGKDMYMLIDTGSANTWVMGSDCTSNACSIHNTFGPSDSTTLNKTKSTFSLSYGTGQVSGVVAYDNVSFAGFKVNTGFGLASTASDDFNNYPMDGILGLGRQSSDELGTPTVMQVLNTAGLIKSNIIGIHLQRAADGTKDGELTFGGMDTSRYTGDLVYAPTLNNAAWEVGTSDVIVDGTPCNFTGKSSILDTGTSYVLMPLADALAVHQLIPGSSHTGENFVVPCTATANIEFVISGQKFSISPKDYVGKPNGNICNSNIIGHQAFGPNQWILGDVFLKNVYTVFDYDKTRIGLGTMTAKAAVSSSSSVSTTKPTSTSASSSSKSSNTTFVPSTTVSNTSTTSSDAARSTTTSSNDSSPFGNSASSKSLSASTSAVNIGLSMLLALTTGILL